MIRSEITGKVYDEGQCVFFRNPVQSCCYMLWGATLVDLIPTKEKKFVYVFSKEDHQDLKLKWKFNNPFVETKGQNGK